MNRPSFIPLFLTAYVALASIMSAACSGAGPAQPIGPVATLSFPTVPPVTGAQFVPAGRPSATRGARIFNASCTGCHGDTGRGDGVQAEFLNPKPPNFADPEEMREQRPDQYYQSISKGVLGSAMIAWDGALTPEQIWDSIAYIWSLHVPATQVTAGRQIYTQECAACHGESGGGDGPERAKSPRPPAALREPRFLAGRTEQQLFQAMGRGVEGMQDHNFAERLQEDQRWAVATFIWTFLFEWGAP